MWDWNQVMGRITLTRNGNTIDFTIPGFPVPNADGVTTSEVIDTLSFGDHHYRDYKSYT